jgi:glycosyltransferase involved in cell wall biosynthesis
LILTVSESNRGDVLKNARVSASKVRMIYLGFQSIVPGPFIKEEIVLTVGEVTENNVERKGLGYFVRLAGEFPDIPFVLVGKAGANSAIEKLKKIAPSNVHFTGFVSSQELAGWMRKSAVYAQFSFHETFGCSVAEAMLCECVPVVTNQFALPEVVGPAGFIVDRADMKKAAQEIRKALDDIEKRVLARKRIVDFFPFEKRKRELNKCIEELMRE